VVVGSAAVMRRWSSDGLQQVAVADGRGKGEAAFDEFVVHLVVKTYEEVGVEFGVAGLEIDEDVYKVFVVVVKGVGYDVVNLKTRSQVTGEFF
jgi:hypothetical protein